MSVTTFDIFDLNKSLKEKNYYFKIHLSDACGNQVLWIEALKDETIDEQLENYIISFFKERRIKIKFNNSKTQFWCI